MEMTGTTAAETRPEANEPERSGAPDDERLPKWILVSLVIHGILVALLLVTGFWPSSKREPPPSYVVDLVGGERIGGKNLGTKLVPETKAKAPKTEPPAAKAPPAPKIAKAEKPSKAEKTPKPEKVEKAKAKAAPVLAIDKPKTKAKPQEEKPVATAKAETKAPSKETTENTESEEDALQKVRERVIQAAIERARHRAATAQATPSAVPGKTDKGEPFSAGSGEGIGAQSLGKGGVGGEGVLKSVEYIRYINYMQATLKNNWAWAGPKRNLKALVRFGVKENGEIVGVKIIQSSGDPVYDESVLRAVKKSSPLAAPPESHRKDFADVEYSFQPDQVG
jgi:colicin import membrane protein